MERERAPLQFGPPHCLSLWLSRHKAPPQAGVTQGWSPDTPQICNKEDAYVRTPLGAWETLMGEGIDIIWTLNTGWNFAEETVVWSLQRLLSLTVTGHPRLTWRMQWQPMALSILAGAVCWAPCVALRPLLHSSMAKGLRLSPGHIQPMGQWLVLKDPGHLSHNTVPRLALHVVWHRCWD